MNIIVAEGSSEPKLTDYGMAKAKTEGTVQIPTDEMSKRVSEAYTAPEVMRNGPVTPASDVYAYGKVGQLLVGSVSITSCGWGLCV